MKRVPLLVALLVALAPFAVAQSIETGLHPPRHGIYVMAHRGAHQGIPENTLAAYKKAIELGADFVEIDVRTAKDGAFVSVHNDSLEAYTGGKVSAKVKDLTLAELKAVDIGSRVGPEWKDERIPTFDEIVEVCKGKIGIYLDLKEAPVAPLIERIKAAGMEKQVLWYANLDEQKQVQKLCPECMPMPDPGPIANLDAVLAIKPKVVASVYDALSKEFVDRCHSAGAIVIVDENGIQSWDDMLAWGTDGIQTDHPEELIARLKDAKAASK